MPKPDKMLRVRPLKELEAAVSKLKRVVLFHPDPIAELQPAQYCICRKNEKKGGTVVLSMIQCEKCWEWFHFVCVGIEDGADTAAMVYTCGWCKSKVKTAKLGTAKESGSAALQRCPKVQHD